jgi:plasmid maintenance system antidote protein VapI
MTRNSGLFAQLFGDAGQARRDGECNDALIQQRMRGVQRKHVNELCNDRHNVTAATALILARVFGNSPDFWLNVQRRSELWEAMHSPRQWKRIERARPLTAAA